MEPGPSILNMAEAMLQNDEYKTSHTSLNDNVDDDDDDENELNGDDGNRHRDEKTTHINNDKQTNRKKSSNGEKRSEGRSVVIREPPKRRKVSAPFTPKEIVDGKLARSLDVDQASFSYCFS